MPCRKYSSTLFTGPWKFLYMASIMIFSKMKWVCGSVQRKNRVYLPQVLPLSHRTWAPVVWVKKICKKETTYCYFLHHLIFLFLTSVHVISVTIHLCCPLSFAEATAVLSPHSSPWIWTFLLTVHHLSHEMEHTGSVSWRTYQYPLPLHRYPSHGSLVCFPWRVPESEIYSHLIPPTPPLNAPIRDFSWSLLFCSNDKTNRLKVCHRCSDLNQRRYSVEDYYKILDPVWPEEIGQPVVL